MADSGRTRSDSGSRPAGGAEHAVASGSKDRGPGGRSGRGRVAGAARSTLRAAVQAAPMILGVLASVSLVMAAVPRSFFARVFTGGPVDPVIGAAVGSIAAGNPITSYIIGGEMAKQGVSLGAITAFLVAWVTVGLVQLPAEIAMLGRRFALIRNLVSFVLAVVVAGLTVLTLRVLS